MLNILRRLKKTAIFREYTMILALVALVIVGALVSDRFLTVRNIMNVLKQYSVIGIVSLGVTFVTIAGTRDLAAGSLLSLTGALFVKMIPGLGDGGALIAALLIGAAIGAFTGSIMAAIKADIGDSFIITFGMLSVLSACAMLTTRGFTLKNEAASSTLFLGNGTLFGVVPMPVVIFFALTIVLNVVLTKLSIGRQIYYLGTNREAAQLVGIRVNLLRVFVYALSGLLTAFAGIILTCRTRSAMGNMGVDYEMDVLAVIAIGGVNLYGGGGSLWNTVLGVLIVAVLSNIFSMLGLGQEAQLMAKGVIIVLAVCIENIKQVRAGE